MTSTPYSRMCRRSAFTLIELLVVISIISLLMALLLPALSAVGTAARSAACLSNERQIGVAVAAYAGDFKDVLPHSYIFQDVPFRFAKATGLDMDFNNVSSRKPNVFQCPDNEGRIYYQVQSNYAWNGWISYTDFVVYHWTKLGHIREPAISVAFGDSGFRTGAPPVPGPAFLLRPNAQFSYQMGYWHSRAGESALGTVGNCNVQFFDGHSTTLDRISFDALFNAKQLLMTATNTYPTGGPYW